MNNKKEQEKQNEEISEKTSMESDITNSSATIINNQDFTFSNPLNEEVPDTDPFEQDFDEDD